MTRNQWWPLHDEKMFDTPAAPPKSRRRLASYKDAGRSLRLVERERCLRAGARHLRSRAASGKRPAGITTGLRLDRWTGTGDGGVTAAEATSQEARTGAERRRWFASARTAVERR